MPNFVTYYIHNARNAVLDSLIFQISWGSMPPDQGIKDAFVELE